MIRFHQAVVDDAVTDRSGTCGHFREHDVFQIDLVVVTIDPVTLTGSGRHVVIVENPAHRCRHGDIETAHPRLIGNQIDLLASRQNDLTVRRRDATAIQDMRRKHKRLAARGHGELCTSFDPNLTRRVADHRTRDLPGRIEANKLVWASLPEVAKLRLRDARRRWIVENQQLLVDAGAELLVRQAERRCDEAVDVDLAGSAKDDAVLVDDIDLPFGLNGAENPAWRQRRIGDAVERDPVRLVSTARGLVEIDIGLAADIEARPVQDRLLFGLLDLDLSTPIRLRLRGLAGADPDIRHGAGAWRDDQAARHQPVRYSSRARKRGGAGAALCIADRLQRLGSTRHGFDRLASRRRRLLRACSRGCSGDCRRIGCCRRSAAAAETTRFRARNRSEQSEQADADKQPAAIERLARMAR